MLEAIVLLLSLATCALILIAFWGLDLLRIRSSSVSSRILPTDRA